MAVDSSGRASLRARIGWISQCGAFEQSTFDFTGLGQSGGEFADSSFGGNVRDLVAAASAMEAAGISPSLLIGHSFGGAAVLAAAGDLPTIKAVATLAAPFDVNHIKHQFLGDELARLEAEGEAEVKLGGRPFKRKKGFIDDLVQDDQAQRIGALKRSLLILHAPLDSYVGIENATLIFEAARHPKSFVSLDGADHLLTKAGCELCCRSHRRLGIALHHWRHAAAHGGAAGICRRRGSRPGCFSGRSLGRRRTLLRGRTSRSWRHG